MPVLIVKQLMKGKLVYGEPNMEGTIPWYFVSAWLEKTKNAMKCSEFDKAFKIIYVWVTNKDISSLPQMMPEDFVLVYQKNVQEYFGPSVSLMANLIELEEPNDI